MDQHEDLTEVLRPHLRVHWVAGPDAGRSVVVSPGRHLVGRAPGCALRCDDPSVAAHAAVLDARPDTDLPGDALPGGEWWWRLGDSVLRPRWTSGPQADERHPGVVVRQPRRLPSPPALPPPPAAPGVEPVASTNLIGLLPSLLGVVAAVAIGWLTGQVAFVVMGVLGSLVGVGTWTGGWFADRRARHRRRVEQRREEAAADDQRSAARAAVVAHHLAVTPSLADALDAVHHAPSPLWNRRADHDDAFVVTLGTTTVAWPDELRRPGALDGDGHPGLATVSLAAGRVVAVRGGAAQAAAVVRGLLVQLLSLHGPADLRLAVVTDRAERWAWLAGVPHAPTGRSTVVVAGPDLHAATRHLGHGDPHLVLVVDVPDALAAPGHPVRRLLSARPSTAVVAILDDDRPTPQACSGEFTVDARWRGRWVADTRIGGLPALVHAAGLHATDAARAAAVLRDCVDPESEAPAGSLPGHVSLGGLGSDLDEAAIAVSWSTAGSSVGLAAPLGVIDDDARTFTVDLVADGPHALVAGTTGSGKSELLRTWITSLAVTHPPEVVTFVLVDFKGGAAFDGLADLPHVAGSVTDLDGTGIDRCLAALHAELGRRERVLRAAGVADLARLSRGAAGTPPRLVVVVDEFATLAHEQPDRLAALVDIGRRGRSLGIHLVLATQRPAGVITDDLRANTGMRIALRLHDAVDAVDVIGDASPASFPTDTPGRAAIRLDGTVSVFQTACTIDIDRIVTAVAGAAAATGRCVTDPLWGPPLPNEVEWRPGQPIGVIDDPTRPCRPALRPPVDGHLLVVASPSTAALTVETLVRDARSRGEEVYVLGETAALRRCGAEVVRPDDGERRRRLLRRLSTPCRPGRLLVVEPLHVLRQHLGDDVHDELAALADLLRNDAAVTRVVVVAEQPTDVPGTWLGRFAQRWVGHLLDPLEATAVGVPPGQVPPAVIGRIAVVAGHDPVRSAQVGRWTGELHVVDVTTPVTAPVEVLPDRIDDGDIDPPQGTITIGMEADELSPAAVRVDIETPFVVVGPPRSGRSTALGRVVGEWRRVHPGAGVVVLAPRRSALAGAGSAVARSVDELIDRLLAPPSSTGTPTLVVVDDAELVDDPRLADLARRDDLAVAAAATPDGLRHAYGPWGAVLRGARNGLLAASCERLDGDLLGATLPRVATVDPRPGLMWSVTDGELTLVQVALPGVVAGCRSARR